MKKYIADLQRNPSKVFKVMRQHKQQQAAKFPAVKAAQLLSVVDQQLLQLANFKLAIEAKTKTPELINFDKRIDRLNHYLSNFHTKLERVIAKKDSHNLAIFQKRHHDFYQVKFDEFNAIATKLDIVTQPAAATTPVPNTEQSQPVAPATPKPDTQPQPIQPAKPAEPTTTPAAQKSDNPLIDLLGDGSFGDKDRKKSNSPESKKLNADSVKEALSSLNSSKDKIAALEDAFKKIISQEKDQSYSYCKRRKPHGFLFFGLRKDGLHFTGTQQRHMKHLKNAYLDILREEVASGHAEDFKQAAQDSPLLNMVRSNYQISQGKETGSHKTAMKLVS